MLHVFVDESGDLGFTSGSSRNFIFTLLMTRQSKKVEAVIKRIQRGIKKSKHRSGELHAYHAGDDVKRQVLEALTRIGDVEVHTISLNKDKVHINLRGQRNILYNYVANILMDRLHRDPTFAKSESAEIIFDQKDTKRSLKEHFSSYLEEGFRDRGTAKPKIIILPSHKHRGLQAVDFVSWSMFRKYERGDETFSSIIQHMVVQEGKLFH